MQSRLLDRSLATPEHKMVCTTAGDIVCGYSAAAQDVCAPIEKCAGGICGATCCLCLPICICLACFSDPLSAPTQAPPERMCEEMGNEGNKCGVYSARLFLRLIGGVLGVLCLPCEAVNRSTETATIAGNQHTLFCCPTVSIEKINSIKFGETPENLFRVASAPPAQVMA